MSLQLQSPRFLFSVIIYALFILKTKIVGYYRGSKRTWKNWSNSLSSSPWSVMHEDKQTTKLCVVFDASAKQEGTQSKWVLGKGTSTNPTIIWHFTTFSNISYSIDRWYWEGVFAKAQNHLLYPHRLEPISLSNRNSFEQNIECNIYFNDLSKLLSQFWRRWRQEYLSELRESHKIKRKSFSQRKNV